MASKLLLMLVLATVAVTSVVGQRNIALSGPEVRRLELGQNPELLERAALVGESVIIVIDNPENIAPVQENVNANFWCLPWLQRFPGGSIEWLFQSADPETGVPNGALERVSSDVTQTIGGRLNEWLNITATILVQGAESPSSGLYICEVCLFRDTPFEECHLANTSLQVLGGPPILSDTEDNNPIVDTSTMQVYVIGSDFCIDPAYDGTVTIQCDIFNFGDQRNTSVSRAFPTPDRSWSFNGDLLDRAPAGENFNIRDNTDFFIESDRRMVLAPDFFIPDVLVTPTGTNQGAIQFNFALQNTTMLMAVDSINTIEEARVEARLALVGEWTCQANNSFGSDMATSNVRLCGDPPNIQRCSSTLFSVDGDVIPVGCTVCIPEGASISINCSGTSESEVMYEWRNGAGIVVSTSPVLTTGINDNFTCTATNRDNAPEVAVSVIAYSDTVTFTARTTEEFRTIPRMDSGCSRLNNQSGLENVALCAFIGERLDFSCATDDTAMTPLEISAPTGDQSVGNLTVMDVTTASEGIYQCRLSSDPGPCAQATVEREVQVFDPATISRTSTLPLTCTAGAGRLTSTIFQSVGSRVQLCCPYNGIEEPSRGWFRISVDELGCATEVPVMENENTFINDDEAADLLTLDVDVGGDVTYVCRVSNRAGSDADIVSIRTDPIEFVWSTSDFSACDVMCQDGVRTRSVVCRNSRDGMIVPDIMCVSAERPADTMSCAAEFPNICLLDPVWIPDPWSPCSKDCGGGFRFRSIRCIIPTLMQIVDNSECSRLTRPPIFDIAGCANECCTKDENPIFCKAEGQGSCSDPSFQKECCWTCGLKIVGRG